MSALHIERGISLAAHTTLELGGPAEYFAKIHTRDQLLEALLWARKRSLAVTVLGGGSNVVVSDRGVAGLVLVLATHGVTCEANAPWKVTAQAGENWDALVAYSVTQQLAGIECLSGIPGNVGAAPIQNIGAYGQELAHRVKAVEVLNLQSLDSFWIDHEQCDFGYRHSRWKRTPGREILLSVRLDLQRGGQPCVRYAELARTLADGPITLERVRQTVLDLRRSKSMLLEPNSTDPNRRSVGSFFLNPVLTASDAQRVGAIAQARGLIEDASALPQYPQPDGRVKLSAAWLIEHSGTRKGETHGPVGISSRHCLALVHHGGGTAQALLALADKVRERVVAQFAIELAPEPVLLGFAAGSTLA